MAERTGFNRLIGDIADLCELQLELLAVDGKKACKTGFMAAVFLSLAIATAISVTTVLLAALAWFLHSSWDWSLVNSLLISGAIGALMSIALLVGTYLSAKYSIASLEESRGEFAQNLAWLKSLIVGGERTLPSTSSDKETSSNFGKGSFKDSRQPPRWDAERVNR